MAREPAKRRPAPLPLPTASEAAFDALLASFGGLRANDATAATRTPTDAAPSAATPDSAAAGSSGFRAPAAEAAVHDSARSKVTAPHPAGEAAMDDSRAASAASGTPDATEPQAFIAGLYERSASFLERDRFASIGAANEFFTKVVGVTFEGRQDIIAGLRPGVPVVLERQAHNVHDPNAIAVYFGELQLGYLRREIARRLAGQFDDGERYRATIGSVTGGAQRSFGVNLHVVRERPERVQQQSSVSAAPSREVVLRALIGDRPLRDAQRLVLERVRNGHNTLAVFGTGRGKSLCFQYPAACAALESGRKTVVLYPLRALANDQFEALRQRLEPLGVRTLRANGSIDAAERAVLMDALETGAWDILCSTPEFLSHHLERFTSAVSRPQLVVVDEAHHLFESTHRPAYARIGTALTALGSPQVLALTATASDDGFAHLAAVLAIDAWVIDPTVRANLAVVDAREVTNKIAYIAEHAGETGKSIVYCNSRTEATKIAQKLRTVFGDTVAFYHAGVPSADRSQIEALFRQSAIRIVIATSAFGEGIDLPDVRDVFLYHLNFDFTEFNQQSGRAGRDGEDARIHLLFGEKDRRLNDFIIERAAPPLHTLRSMYREIRKLGSDGTVRQTYGDIADTLGMDKVEAGTVGAAARIFADAGLIELGEDDDGRYLRFLDVKEKLDLTRTARYAEGEAERESFERFCKLVLAAQRGVLENIINRPIYPSNVRLVR